jgi:hypothetical protein
MSFAVAFKVQPDRSASEAWDALDIPHKQAAIEAGGELLKSAISTVSWMCANVAKPNETVQVSISGHWNGGFEPKPGWASNALTISVTQVYNPET